MTNTTTSGISRRTLAKGAAWAAPAVAIAAAAPMAAASPPLPPCVAFGYTGRPCRRSNEGIYKFGFAISNDCTDLTLTICVTRLTNQSGKMLVPQASVLPACAVLSPGGKLTVREVVWIGDSQGNGVNVYGTVNNGPEQLLFTRDAPQKTNNCAPGVSAPAAAAAEAETETTTEAEKVEETTTTTEAPTTTTTTEAPTTTTATTTEAPVAEPTASATPTPEG